MLGNQWLVQKQDKRAVKNILLLPNPVEKMARLTYMWLHNFFLLSVTLNLFLSLAGRKTQGFEGPIQRTGWQSTLLNCKTEAVNGKRSQRSAYRNLYVMTAATTSLPNEAFHWCFHKKDDLNLTIRNVYLLLSQ